MANKFITVLDKVGDAIKWAFTNKTAEEIEQGGLQIAEIAFPALDPLLGGLSKSLATAQGLAANANTTGQNTAQVSALVLADAQQVFQEYQTTTGANVETAQQKAIISAFIALLSEIPGAVTPVGAPIPTQPAPSVQTQTAEGTLL